MRACPGCQRVWQEAHDFCPADGTPLVLVRGDDDPLLGLVLDGRYRLRALLGTGGMGFVYRAEQVGLGRRVAVKMLWAERTRDPTSRKRFEREARALASLDHPGVVRVVDYGDHEGRAPYLVMHEADGPPLDVVLRDRGALPPRLAVKVAAQLAEALAAAHRANVVHRDLKPANVHLGLRGGEAQARVLDFGLAQVVAEGEDLLSAQTRLTRKGTVFGTPEYMAPEQVRGLGADHRTDLYSLGIVLFEMLTGSPPFVGPTASRVLAQQAESPPPPVALPGVDGAAVARVQAVVHGLLAKAPADRPQRAERVADALRRLLPELPPVDEAGFLARSAAPATAPAEPTGPSLDTDVFAGVATAADADRALAATLSAARRERRARVALAVAGGLALVALALPGVLAWAGRDRAPGPVRPSGPMLTPTSAPTGQATGAAQLPGGEAQARYEASLRELQASLAARGLRDGDLRIFPQARALWLAQAAAAGADRFEDAASTLDELRRFAGSVSNERFLVLRLGAVRRLATPTAGPALAELEAELPQAAGDPGRTRRFLERLQALEGAAGSR